MTNSKISWDAILTSNIQDAFDFSVEEQKVARTDYSVKYQPSGDPAFKPNQQIASKEEKHINLEIRSLLLERLGHVQRNGIVSANISGGS